MVCVLSGEAEEDAASASSHPDWAHPHWSGEQCLSSIHALQVNKPQQQTTPQGGETTGQLSSTSSHSLPKTSTLGWRGPVLIHQSFTDLTNGWLKKDLERYGFSSNY